MTLTIPPEVIEAHRPVLADWVQANGIDPRTVPLHHPIRVQEGEGGAVIFRAFVLDEHGSLKVNPDQPDEIMAVERTMPCTVPPPDLGATEADA